MEHRIPGLTTSAWKSGPLGPGQRTNMMFASFSTTGPEGPSDHAANAAINGRSSTVNSDKNV